MATTCIKPCPPSSDHPRPLLLFVEGQHDIEFLRHVSRKASKEDDSIADLGAEEANGQLIFIPNGGGNLTSSAFRFASLGFQEFHIVDREVPPVSGERKDLVDRLNDRPNATAVLTRGRSMENYLPPATTRRTLELDVDYDWGDDVAEIVAAAQLALRDPSADWERLQRHAKKRLRDRAKRLINRDIAAHVTLDGLWQHDPAEDVARWLRYITAAIRQPAAS